MYFSCLWSYRNGCVTGEPEETEDRKPSLDNFEFLKKLGEGGYGVVILAKGRLPGGPNKEYAIKALKKEGITSSKICDIFTEKEALQISSGCPFITMLYACFQNKVCLNFWNFLHSFRLSLILRCTVSMKIWQFFFVPVATCIDQLWLLFYYSCERNKCIYILITDH